MLQTSRIIVLFVVLGFSTCAYALSVETQLDSDRVLVGNPLTLTVTITSSDPVTLPDFFDPCDGHTTIHVKDKNGKEARWVPLVDCRSVGGSGPVTYPPGTQLAEQIFLGVGEYSIQVSYGSNSLSPRVWNGSVSSNPTSFVVVSPQNPKDLAVWQAYGQNLVPSASPQVYRDFLIRNEQEIIEHHPSSEYAAYAYAAANKIPVIQKKWSTAISKDYYEYLLRIKRSLKGSDADSVRTQRQLRITIKQGESVCSSGNSLPICERIKYFVADCYAQLFEFEEAAHIYETLSMTGANPRIRSNSATRLSVLKQMGLSSIERE